MTNFLKEKNGGQLSSMRLVFLIWCIVFSIVWAVVSKKTSILQPVPQSLIILTGIFAGTKTIQRFGEK